MKSKSGFTLIPAIILLAVSILIGGCTQEKSATTAPTTKVSKPSEIVLNNIIDLTGPMAAMNKSAVSGSMDAAKVISEKGGVDGVPLRVVWHDTRYEVPTAISIYSKLREQTPRPLSLGVYITQDVDALAARFAEDKIVCNTTSVTQRAVWPPAWVFGFSGTYPDMQGAFMDFLSKEWAKSGETRKCKLVLFTANTATGAMCTTPEVMEYIKTKDNIELVDAVQFDSKVMDLSSDILRIMQNKPDWIEGFYYGAPGAAFYKSLAAAGLQGKVKVGNISWGMQTQIVQQVGPELVEGVIGPHCIPPFTPKGTPQISPGMEMISKMFDDNNRPAIDRDGGYTAGALMAYWQAGEIKKALDKVGWDKLNGTALYDAYTGTRSIDLGGVASWGIAEGTRTNNKYQIFQFKNGNLVTQGEWMTTPDLRPKEFRTKESGWTGAGWPTGWFK